MNSLKRSSRKSGSQDSGSDSSTRRGVSGFLKRVFKPSKSTTSTPQHPSRQPNTQTSNVPLAIGPLAGTSSATLTDRTVDTNHSTSTRNIGSSSAQQQPPPGGPQSETPSLWERTLKIVQTMLREHGLPPLNENTFKSTSSVENIQSVIETLRLETGQKDDQKDNQNDEQNDDQKERRERLKRVLQRVDKYTKIVDTAVQHSPEVTALVWAGIRGILQVRMLFGSENLLLLN